MKISDILKLETNKAVQGTFTVKTAKKIWQDSDGYVHQVLLTDPTGDMLADCFVGDFNKINRGMQIDLIQAMTQHGEAGIRLYVQEWKYSGEAISEPPEQMSHDDRVVRSKIKCRLAEAYLIHYGEESITVFLKSKDCEEIITEIMK